MHRIGLLLAGLLLFSTSVVAQDADPQRDRTAYLVATPEGPRLVDEPGALVYNVAMAFYPGPHVVRIRNDDAAPRTLHVGKPLSLSVGPIAPGETGELRFTMPESDNAEARYWIDDASPHDGSGWITTYRLLYGVPHCHGDICPHDGHVMAELNITHGADGAVLRDAATAWPTLKLTAPSYMMFMVKNTGQGTHTLHLGAPVDKTSDPIAPGETAQLSFTLDEPASFRYWLDGVETTSGTVEAKAASPERETPPAHLALVALAIAAAALFTRRT